MLKPIVNASSTAYYDSVAHLGVPHCRNRLIVMELEMVLTLNQMI